MQEFVIKWKLDSKVMPLGVNSVEELQTHERAYHYVSNGAKWNITEINLKNGKLIIMGDPILTRGAKSLEELFSNGFTGQEIARLGGFFHLIHISEDMRLCAASGSLGVLPLYCHKQENTVYVSNSTKLLRIACNRSFTLDRQYLLERLLFNFALLNRTHWQGISTVKAHHYLELGDTLREKPFWNPCDHLVSQPPKGKEVLESIADRFIENTANYFPSGQYALTFTGGFDGRTLLAVSLLNGRNPLTYSFGSLDSEDVTLPLAQAKTLGLNYHPIYLDEDYIAQHSYEDGLKLIELSEGGASFSRAHYLYAAKMISASYEHILTGNFGSELFRAAHVPGVVISQAVFNLFANPGIDHLPAVVFQAPELKYLRREHFGKEMESLVEEMRVYKEKYRGMDPNTMLYIHNLNETCRKYYGPEVLMQSHYLHNRSPYLDYGLISFLMGTYYSGAYSDFSTDNPVKRFKGQQPYGYIIKKAFPPLYGLLTNKGYKPSALVHPLGKLKLVGNLAKKKLGLSPSSSDPFSVAAAFSHNLAKHEELELDRHLYNDQIIWKELRASSLTASRGTLFNILSTNYYLNNALGK